MRERVISARRTQHESKSDVRRRCQHERKSGVNTRERVVSARRNMISASMRESKRDSAREKERCQHKGTSLAQSAVSTREEWCQH
jgi:hypothetical protein